MKYLAYLILILTIGFNIYLNYPETKILADPNDNIFQFSLVNRTNWVWQNYGCPLSVNCLPNLVDHLVPNWAEGYPLPFYYSHIPQIAIVATYNLIIHPIFSIFPPKADQPWAGNFSLYQYYNWTKYLLLVFFPLPVFLALRIVGINPLLASITAFFAANISTDGLYGIDPPSFLWRGYGLTSQLYAMFFFPLGIAFTYRSLKKLSLSNSMNSNQIPSSNRKFSIFNSQSIFKFKFSNFKFIKNFKSGALWANSNSVLAVVFLTLTTAGHLGVGIIGFLSTLPFLFLDLNKRDIYLRSKKLFVILSSCLLILSYWIIPILLYNNYHIISFWDPLWKFNSYGWFEVVRQFFSGEIFDWQRWPIITGLVIIGLFTILLDSNLFPFGILFILWMLLYFGRTTWGGLIDLIPGMKDFHQHRFIVGIHLASLFLIPTGLQFLLLVIKKAIEYTYERAVMIKHVFDTTFNLSSESSSRERPHLNPLLKGEENSHYPSPIRRGQDEVIFYILIATIIIILTYLTIQQTVKYAQLNNRWIGEANTAYKYDEKNFTDLLSYLNTLPQARTYAGRPGNWGKEFRLGSSQMYMLFGVNHLDISQFLPETWSMMSENDQNFDERVTRDYDLLNIKYIVSSKNEGFPSEAILNKKFGPFELYQVPTTGWFDLVTSPMFVKSEKTNFLNIVYLWHRSYPRLWKMHPLISVDKNPDIPAGMQRILKMVDEVSYEELPLNSPQPPLKLRGGEGGVKNIFSDFPYIFPQSTVSGQIRSEKVERQSYSATVEVPNPCNQCMIMFKMSYHPDWKAKVDGQEVTKYAVFPYYLAVSATPGTHTIEFTYEPNKLKVLLISFELITIFMVIIFINKFRKIIHNIIEN